MNNLKRPIAALIVALFATPVFAQSDRTAGIDNRQAEQKQRIEQGVASGAITDREAAGLQRGQRRVQRLEDQAKQDGSVSREERRAISRELDKQAENIRVAETNSEVRGNAETIDQRQANQRSRIEKGVASGVLTSKAAASLYRGQDRVQRMETKAKASGSVSAEESARIRVEQDKQGEAIRVATRGG